jgi:choline dehydrogenase-like flavoprotein
MDHVLRLAERWLRAHGSPQPEQLVKRAASRAARYPAPVGSLWPAVLGGMEWLAPAAVLGDPRRASALDDVSFDQLDRALQLHPIRAVRLAWLLVRAPLLEERYPEPVPPQKDHPLDALRELIAERASHSNHTFDVIVVGSGAGGAPLAWRLSREGLKVAIVESGGRVAPEVAARAVERHYVDQGMLGSLSGGGTTLVIAGRAVGGTTVINSGTSLRPPAARLEAWDQVAGTSFASGDLEPYLDEVHELLGIAPVPERNLDASARLVREGLQRIGRPGAYPLPRNAPGCEGSARCCFGCPTGAKLSTDRAFLPEAIEAGATLLARTEALGMRSSRDGVEVYVRSTDGVRRLRAKTLVLSAGAIYTPGLLRKSRLGAWREAGQGLRIHPATKAFGWMPEPLPHGGVPQALGYDTPELPHVKFEGAHTPPSVTATVLSAAGQRHRLWMDHHDHLANFGFMVRDRGAGRVRQVGGKVVLDYQMHDDDAHDMGKALRIVAEALFAAGAERVLLPVFSEEAELDSLSALDRWPARRFSRHNLLASGFHPQGTAAIGRVVDGQLQLHDAENVYVCDASVLPESPGVNPQVTLMALSLRLANHLLQGQETVREVPWVSARAS